MKITEKKLLEIINRAVMTILEQGSSEGEPMQSRPREISRPIESVSFDEANATPNEIMLYRRAAQLERRHKEYIEALYDRLEKLSEDFSLVNDRLFDTDQEVNKILQWLEERTKTG